MKQEKDESSTTELRSHRQQGPAQEEPHGEIPPQFII